MNKRHLQSPFNENETKNQCNDDFSATQKPSWWQQVWNVYRQPSVLRMLFLGFCAGLPLLLVMGTLSFRLREAKIDRATIGYLSWVATLYGFKWVWSPLVDKLQIPVITKRLGKRRAWLIVAQVCTALCLVGLGFSNPQNQLMQLVLFALGVAFFSATQDVVLDAFRIESAQLEQQAALSATYQTGYRLGMIWAKAGALSLAAFATPMGWVGYSQQSWQMAYSIMAASMLIGIVVVLFSHEPKPALDAQQNAEQTQILTASGHNHTIRTKFIKVILWLEQALVQPFQDFFKRYGLMALLILLLIATYRISDIVMGAMADTFYVDKGYSKEQIASISSVYGVLMTLLGTFIGGALALRLGVMRLMMLGAILGASSNLLFAWLSVQEANVIFLTAVISADNLSSGLASAAFIAYLSSLTSIRYTATQYALFSSMMLLLPKFLAGFSGRFVDEFGYVNFFVTTAILGIPVCILVALAIHYGKKRNKQEML